MSGISIGLSELKPYVSGAISDVSNFIMQVGSGAVFQHIHVMIIEKPMMAILVFCVLGVAAITTYLIEPKAYNPYYL